MPAYPLVRGLPPFAADESSSKETLTCNKFSGRHNQLTPGIFTLFCPHEVCLGFKLMNNNEGPGTLFELLFTRFRNGACSCYMQTIAAIPLSLLGCRSACCAGPRRIIYDNACNLHRYSLRRAPRLFAKTEFRIDRLHIFNHIGCDSLNAPQHSSS
jgi:hypothetical protein